MQTNEERIRQRAYEIWEAEGRPEGREYSRWLRARSEIAQADAGIADRVQDAPPSDRTDWLDWSALAGMRRWRPTLA
ncbi:DUF2934 domain-containing protein [Shinella daejeonensis]|uniref:DUF2934 domain-containing protein n=1 Tax=Shinella daejeonensis TaxID=659017 RepID=UPI003F5CEAB9|nr:DUF2934 domain-containing protein [Shinella daejeonensis]